MAAIAGLGGVAGKVLKQIKGNPAFRPRGPALAAAHAFALGLLVGMGACLVLFSGGGLGVVPLGLYLLALGTFHALEYSLTALFHPDTLSVDSFLINHSKAFWTAMGASWLEFVLELWLAPWLKALWPVTLLGFAVVVAGQALRTYAMWSAGVSFTHLVAYEKRDEHVLVTSGIYSICRHPSYVGFFYWSIATQVVLVNPVCIIGFAVASWFFFADRIPDEEEQLIEFFHEDYIKFRKTVPSGIPFIA